MSANSFNVNFVTNKGFARIIILIMLFCRALDKYFLYRSVLMSGFIFISCTPTHNNIHNQTRKENRDLIININGANALYPLAQVWADEYSKLHAEVRITVFPASSNKGKTDALLKLADIGMYSNLPQEDLGRDLLVFAVAKDAVVATFNSGNPSREILRTKGLDKEQLRKVFLNSGTTSWGELTGSSSDDKVEVFTRSDASGAASIWAEFLGCGREELQGIGVYGDPGMTQAVRNNTNSIGYDNLRFVFDNLTGNKYQGLDVIPIDFNQNGKIDSLENFNNNLVDFNKAVRNGDYPYPLSRNLYFLVRKDLDNPHVVDFLEWVMTEGQQLVEYAGYVKLDSKEIDKERDKLTYLNNNINKDDQENP